MICIGTLGDKDVKLDSLAQKHWEWFANRIAYDKEESELSNKEKKELGNAIKINTALRKMLGHLYNELELIIKANYDQLKTYKNEIEFVNGEVPIDAIKKEHDQICEKWKQQISIVRNLQGKKKHDKALKNEYKEANKVRADLYAEMLKKKAVLDDIEEKNKIERERFCNSTSCNITLDQGDEEVTVEKTLIDLMGYKDFCNKDNKDDWNAYEMCKELGVTVCPYCNRQYIFTIDSSNGCVRPQLDHFFPKSKYPLLSCSFYNMIPSCPSCNILKANKDVPLVYPYKEEFGKNGCFEIMLDDYLFIKVKKSIEDCVSVKISLDECNDENLKPKIEKAKEIFLLDELYNKHQIELKDLLLRYSYFRSLTRKQLEKWGLIDEDMSLKDLLLGLPMMSSDDTVYPLKKMKKDIISQIECNDK